MTALPCHYTAWMTNDLSCLMGDVMDIAVIEDEATSFREEVISEEYDFANGETTREVREVPVWESRGAQVFYAETGVDAREGTAEDGIKAAEELLEAAGWRVVGDWEALPASYVATVEYIGGYRHTVEAAAPSGEWAPVHTSNRVEPSDADSAREHGQQLLRQWLREHRAPLANVDGRPVFRVRVRTQSGDGVLATVTSSRAEMTAAAFKVARESMGLSDGWLAAHLGKSSRMVRNYESGHAIPAAVGEEATALLRRTRQEVETLVEAVRDDPFAEVVTYATDAAYRLARPDGEFPASWHRAVVAQVAARAPHIRITYAG
ncbi:helix-turn-helix domain-containing protein [Streptomyces olivaceus]